MLSPEHIAEAARRLVAQAGHPAKVILFGSYARGMQMTLQIWT